MLYLTTFDVLISQRGVNFLCICVFFIYYYFFIKIRDRIKTVCRPEPRCSAKIGPVAAVKLASAGENSLCSVYRSLCSLFRKSIQELARRTRADLQRAFAANVFVFHTPLRFALCNFGAHLYRNSSTVSRVAERLVKAGDDAVKDARRNSIACRKSDYRTRASERTINRSN